MEIVGNILSSLSEKDRILLKHCLALSDSLRSLVKTHHKSEEEVAEKFEVPIDKVKDFLCGNWNYTISEISQLNAWFVELETAALQEKVPAKVAE